MSIITNNLTKEVYGALLGIRNENKIEVFYSFEFLNSSSDSKLPKFNIEFIENRKNLTDQLFQQQNYEIIGFYATNENETFISEEQKQELLSVMNFYKIENPCLLILNTNLEKTEELPVEIFYNFDKDNKNYFRKIPHKIEGSDSERITLDTVMKFSESELTEKESATKQNLKTFKNALDVLRANLGDLLKAAIDGKFAQDLTFQAMLSDVFSNLPASNNKNINQILENNNYENTIMNSLCSCTLNQVHAKNYEYNIKNFHQPKINLNK